MLCDFLFCYSTRLLTSELGGLSVTVGSLERQLADRESDCDSLRRQVEAGGDRSKREHELVGQVRWWRCMFHEEHFGSADNRATEEVETRAFG